MLEPTFVIEGGRIFDGESVRESGSVLVHGEQILDVVDRLELDLASDVERIDARGKTLLPGLIDAHAHPGLIDSRANPKPPVLKQAIVFGVTTVLDMFSLPGPVNSQREQARLRNDVADVRSASIGATVPGGHPTQMLRETFPTIAALADVPGFVAARVDEGADYIKLIIDDGSAKANPLPAMSLEMATAIVREAHKRNKIAVAHVLTLRGAKKAIDAGVDGLMHVFMDSKPTPEIVASIVRSGMFVTPTLTMLGSLAGDLTGAALAQDKRVVGLVTSEWQENLCSCFPHKGPARLEYALEVTRALHEQGVDILAGTDTGIVGILGTAYGVSLHGEMGLLVQAGLTPIEALRAATSLPAKRFGLKDRGRIKNGLQADLVLVDGDPTTKIGDSLSIHTIWRRGERLDRDGYRRLLRDQIAK